MQELMIDIELLIIFCQWKYLLGQGYGLYGFLYRLCSYSLETNSATLSE